MNKDSPEPRENCLSQLSLGFRSSCLLSSLLQAGHPSYLLTPRGCCLPASSVETEKDLKVNCLLKDLLCSLKQLGEMFWFDLVGLSLLVYFIESSTALVLLSCQG